MEDLTFEQVEHFRVVARTLLEKGLPTTVQNLLDNGADSEVLIKLANTGVITIKKDGAVIIAWHLNRYNPEATLDKLMYKLYRVVYTFTFKEDLLKEFEDGLIPIEFPAEDLSKYFKKIPNATK